MGSLWVSPTTGNVILFCSHFQFLSHTAIAVNRYAAILLPMIRNKVGTAHSNFQRDTRMTFQLWKSMGVDSTNYSNGGIRRKFGGSS